MGVEKFQNYSGRSIFSRKNEMIYLELLSRNFATHFAETIMVLTVTIMMMNGLMTRIRKTQNYGGNFG